MAGMEFEGRVAIVTGAGNGLGRAHALTLASRGAKVIVNDLGGSVTGDGASDAAAETVVSEIQQAGGIAVADTNSVATPEGGAAIVETALDAFGRVDIVVNNAGILRDRAFHNMSFDDVRAVLDVHLLGSFHVTQPAWKRMREQQFGRVVFTASSAGLFGNFGQANYGAAKMGLVGLTHVLALEGKKHGIATNAIAPMALTRMTEGLIEGDADRFDPALVSAVVAYLAHEDCDVNGHVYSCGAGRVARVFMGVSRGVTGGISTPEDVRASLAAISTTDGDFFVPDSAGSEVALAFG